MGKNNTVVLLRNQGQMKATLGRCGQGRQTDARRLGVRAHGKTYKMKGNLPWDAAAYKVVNDHTYGITTMKGGKVRTTGTSTVSADGKTRTVATEGTDADGKKFKSKGVFDKQ